MRDVARKALQAEDRAALKQFYDRSAGAQSREDLAREWRSIPAFAARPEHLQREIFMHFEEMDDSNLVAGVRAGIELLLRE